MNKNFLLPILAVVLILALGTVGLLFSKGAVQKLTSQITNTGPQTSETDKTVPEKLSPLLNPAYVATASPKMTQIEIDYTEAGFQPNKVTIKKGTAVVFYNKQGQTLATLPTSPQTPPNPASPSSGQKTTSAPAKMQIVSDLRAFNQTLAGDVYAFTFTEAGTFTYHNQLRPSDQGTITVTE